MESQRTSFAASQRSAKCNQDKKNFSPKGGLQKHSRVGFLCVRYLIYLMFSPVLILLQSLATLLQGSAVTVCYKMSFLHKGNVTLRYKMGGFVSALPHSKQTLKKQGNVCFLANQSHTSTLYEFTSNLVQYSVYVACAEENAMRNLWVTQKDHECPYKEREKRRDCSS